MKFSKIVFWIAGIWGVLALAPLYFMRNTIGRLDPPPITHPGFFYGFAGVGLAWQFAFLVMATDPARYRPMIWPSVFEKFSYAGAMLILFLQNRIHPSDLAFVLTDLTLGILFIVCYFRLKTEERENTKSAI
jgi:hypothetical protein